MQHSYVEFQKSWVCGRRWRRFIGFNHPADQSQTDGGFMGESPTEIFLFGLLGQVLTFAFVRLR